MSSPRIIRNENTATCSDNEADNSYSTYVDENEEETISDSDVSIKEVSGNDLSIVDNKTNLINCYSDEESNAKFILIPDNYFTMRSHKQKSSHDAFSKFIDNEYETETYYDPKQQIIEQHLLSLYSQKYFDEWMYMLINFNVILYGVGSKYSILQQFVAKKLQDYPCIVINGLNPDIQIRHILKTVLVDTLDIKCSITTNVSESIQLIKESLEEYDLDLFFVIHNIDGPVLRKSKYQTFFADMAQIKHVHIVATVDHVNASLLWDNEKMNSLKFYWWNVPTFAPYACDAVVTSQESELCHISYLNNIYKSLTKNLKEIFKVIIEFQLQNEKQEKYEGLLFDKLFTMCREQFLVSSDYTLHNYLKEFMDQKIIKVKLCKDGSEKFIIPFESSILRELLSAQNDE